MLNNYYIPDKKKMIKTTLLVCLVIIGVSVFVLGVDSIILNGLSYILTVAK